MHQEENHPVQWGLDGQTSRMIHFHTRDLGIICPQTLGLQILDLPSLAVGRPRLLTSFTGENQEVCIDDWLPALERASTWNGWTEEECLMQLAGHLRGEPYKSGTF